MAEITKKRRLSDDGAIEASQQIEAVTEDAPKDSQKDGRRSLFVRSFPTTVTSEQLAEYFSQSYPIKHATIVQDPATKTSRGFGFVTFADAEDAQLALTEFNGSKLGGKKIKVELAQSRHRELVGEGGKSVPGPEAVKQKADREKERTDTLPPKLIIRNLPWSIKEPEDLIKLFQSYGKVKSAVIPKNGPRAQSGFGFVVLRGKKNAENALKGVNGKEVDGRTLAVDWAVDKDTWEKMQKTQTEADVDGEAPTEEQAADEDGGVAIDGIDEGSDDDDVPDEDLIAPDLDDEEDEVDDEDMVDNDEELSELEDEEVESDAAEEEEEEDDRNATTIFIRNLPFTATDESLFEHFTQFGPIRYARVVFDQETERSRGTAFVCFYNSDSAKECVINAPKQVISEVSDKKASKSPSMLQDETSDPSGKYTMEGRVLQVSRALSKSAASRKEDEGTDRRNVRDRDRRRLYLLSEGTISAGSPLYEKLGPTEVSMRQASAKQRQNLIKSNPSLHLSLTRLSVRNVPRSVDSKALKQIAREAVVGFATDVKGGLRQPLSKEELARGAEEMKELEKLRKTQGKGIVRQAKIVFESSSGSKVNEKTGAGRSRGYGFIEYYNHRNALMGLRWMNGHAVKSTGAGSKEEKQKRLIVEFAIENAQVVTRRKEIEEKARNGEVKQGRFAPKDGKGFNRGDGDSRRGGRDSGRGDREGGRGGRGGRDFRGGRDGGRGGGRDRGDFRAGRDGGRDGGRGGRDFRGGREGGRGGRDFRGGREGGRGGRDFRSRSDNGPSDGLKRKRSESRVSSNDRTGPPKARKTNDGGKADGGKPKDNGIAMRNRMIAQKRRGRK